MKTALVAVVIVAWAVTSVSLQQTPTYEASAQMLVGWQQGDQWANSGGSGEQFQTLEFRVVAPTMVHAIHTRPVAEEAVQRLELDTSPDELLDNLTVEQVVNTNIIVLTYQSNDPLRATKIVNTVGEVSSEFISERSSQMTATVWEKARVSYDPVSPDPLRNGLLTLVIGLALCVGTVVVRPGVGARMAGALNEWAVRTIGEAELPVDTSEAERTKEQELLEALDRRGKLTAVEASLATSLSVEEANRMLFELAARGHLEVTVEHGRLYYAFWERD